MGIQAHSELAFQLGRECGSAAESLHRLLPTPAELDLLPGVATVGRGDLLVGNGRIEDAGRVVDA